MNSILTKRKPDGNDGSRKAPHQTEIRQDFLVFGYRCKLYRDNANARRERDGSLLVSLHGSAKTDRFDCRLQLPSSQVLHGIAVAASSECSSNEELRYHSEPWLEILDEERFGSLNREEECRAFDNHAVCYAEQQSDDASKVEVEEYAEHPQPPAKLFGAVPYSYSENVSSSSAVIGPAFPPYETPSALQLRPNTDLPSTKNEHELIERTAAFVLERGVQFEIFLKLKQADSNAFGFLQTAHRLNPYYQQILSQLKSGKYAVETTQATSRNAAAEQKFDSDSESDDSEGGYLHPSLFGGAVSHAKLAEPKKPDSSAEVAVKTESPGKPPDQKAEDENTSAFSQLIRRVKQAHEHVSAKFGLAEPQPPPDMVPPPPDMQYIIDALAKHVAEHGDQFEQVVSAQYQSDARFVFLHSAHYLHSYYKFKKLLFRYEFERDRRQLQEGKLMELQAVRAGERSHPSGDFVATKHEDTKVEAAASKAHNEPQAYKPSAENKIAFSLPTAAKSTTKHKNGLDGIPLRRRDAFYCAKYGVENYESDESSTLPPKSNTDETSDDQHKSRVAKARAFIDSQRNKTLDDNVEIEKKSVSAWAKHFEAASVERQKDVADVGHEGLVTSLQEFRRDWLERQEKKEPQPESNGERTDAASGSSSDGLLASLQNFKQQMLTMRKLHDETVIVSSSAVVIDSQTKQPAAPSGDAAGLLASLRDFRGCAAKRRARVAAESSPIVEKCDKAECSQAPVDSGTRERVETPVIAGKTSILPADTSPAEETKLGSSESSSDSSSDAESQRVRRTWKNVRSSKDRRRSSSSERRSGKQKRKKNTDHRKRRSRSSEDSSSDERRRKRHKHRSHRHYRRQDSEDSDDVRASKKKEVLRIAEEKDGRRRRSKSPLPRKRDVLRN